MSGADPRLDPDDAHPRAREALTDAFFWDPSDPSCPFGEETGIEVLEALRDFRDEAPQGSVMELLGELLARWEIADAGWDAIEADEVQALGEADETSLLLRDEVILALAFGQIVVEGRIDAEVRRRAMLALARQALPALLHGSGDAARRALCIDRMREVLVRRWD
jgi:uncharacterized protein YfeS